MEPVSIGADICVGPSVHEPLLLPNIPPVVSCFGRDLEALERRLASGSMTIVLGGAGGRGRRCVRSRLLQGRRCPCLVGERPGGRGTREAIRGLGRIGRDGKLAEVRRLHPACPMERLVMILMGRGPGLGAGQPSLWQGRSGVRWSPGLSPRFPVPFVGTISALMTCIITNKTQSEFLALTVKLTLDRALLRGVAKLSTTITGWEACVSV
jgi:hypothetical protein